MKLIHYIAGIVVGSLLVGVSLLGASKAIEANNSGFIGATPSSYDFPGVYNVTSTDLVLRDGQGSALAVDVNGKLKVSPLSSMSMVTSTANQFYAGAGTASAPSYSFTTDTDTGILNSTSNEVDLTSGGTIKLAVGSTGVVLRAGASLLPGSDNGNDVGSLTGRMRSGFFGTSLNSPAINVTSSGAGITLYNTTDQVTNFEKGFINWVGNTFTIGNSIGGTGVNRDLSIQTAGSNFVISGSAGSSQFNFNRTTGGAITSITSVGGTLSQSSGVIPTSRIVPNITQTGTAGYTGLLINPTETSVGSGVKNLIQAQVGSVDKFTVSNAGITSAGGGSANKAMCWKADGKTLGYCSSVVDVAGGCTCN